MAALKDKALFGFILCSTSKCSLLILVNQDFSLDSINMISSQEEKFDILENKTTAIPVSLDRRLGAYF